MRAADHRVHADPRRRARCRFAEYLKTAADPTGTVVLGTLNNCGGSATPWGTYVTGEENYDFYFRQPPAGDLTLEERRYMQSSLSGAIEGPPSATLASTCSSRGNRNEPNRFGWIVEIDPSDPEVHPAEADGSRPLQARNGSGSSHRRTNARLPTPETTNATTTSTSSSAARTVKQARQLKQSPLEDGTLYVAKFDDGDLASDGMGTGQWIPLTT